MHIWLFLIVSALGAYWLLVTVIAILSVRKMTRVEALLQPVDEPQRLEDPWGVSAWARDHDFTLDSQFDFDGLVGAGGVKLALEGWYSPSKTVFLMHYHVLENYYYEFVSGLKGEYSLTSSKSADSLSLPFPPKAFVQVFEEASLDELLREHEKGLAFLKERFGLMPVAPDRPLRDLILFTLKTQMAQVQSQQLWQLKVGWWYLTRRRRLKNKSVIEQVESLGKDQ
jgi:hypothetical protein